MNYFGSNIKHLREERGIKQDDMYQYVGVTGKTLSNYEMGRTEPPIDMIISLSKFFRVTLDDLFLIDLKFNSQLNKKAKEEVHPESATTTSPSNKKLKAYSSTEEKESLAAESDKELKRPHKTSPSNLNAEIDIIKDIQARTNARLKLLEAQLAKLLRKSVAKK